MIVCGIDPGAKGSAAWLNADSGEIVLSRLHYQDGLLDYRKIWNDAPGDVSLCFLERVRGRGGWSATANFSFGGNYQQVRLCTKVFGWDTINIEPQQWQKIIHDGIQAETPKTRSRLAYTRLFPDDPLPRNRNNKHNENDIDALLIAAYGVLVHRRKIVRPGGIVSWSLDPAS